MATASSSAVKFKVGHVLFIEIVGYPSITDAELGDIQFSLADLC
jgi:hypothetical protein